jgi:hypothetical protein
MVRLKRPHVATVFVTDHRVPIDGIVRGDEPDNHACVCVAAMTGSYWPSMLPSSM